MSDGYRSVKPAVEKVKTAEAIAILVGLAATSAVTEVMVESDPERFAPQRARETEAFDRFEEFLQVHLYGDCNADA